MLNLSWANAVQETCPEGVISATTFQRYFALPAQISNQLLQKFAGLSALGIDLAGFTELCAHCCAEQRAVRRACLFDIFAVSRDGVLELHAEGLQSMLEVLYAFSFACLP